MSVQYATCDASIRACYPVMPQLRPHLQEAAFMAQVQRQMANHDYRLANLQRHDAHRLYLGRKLQISSHHFSMVLA